MKIPSYTAFDNVLLYLCENQELSVDTIAKRLAKHVDIDVTRKTLSEYRRGKRTIKENIIDALSKEFRVNPDYLYDESDIMLKGAASRFESKFKSVFPKWSTITKSSSGHETTKKTRRYLYVTMKDRDYNFLTSYDFAKILKGKGMRSFEEEIKHCEEEYDNANASLEHEYIMIPCKDFIDILSQEELARRTLETLLYSDHYTFFEKECIEKHPELERKHIKLDKTILIEKHKHKNSNSNN